MGLEESGQQGTDKDWKKAKEPTDRVIKEGLGM